MRLLPIPCWLKPRIVLALAPLLPAAALQTLWAGSLPVRFQFDSAAERSSLRLPLQEIDPAFPVDWSGYEALVIELRASSPQRMHLRIETRGPETRSSRVLFHPYPAVWLRAAIPVSMLAEPPRTGHDMAAVGNRSRLGYFLGLWGPFVTLREVEAISFEMEHPVGSPALEIRSIRLERRSPGDAVLDGAPVVDRFGRLRSGTWPGKAADLEDLQRAWARETAELQAGNFGFCNYGGFLGTQARATGFFRVERIDGRWWFVDPDGHLFLSLGCDVIQPYMVTPSAGRETVFEERPPAELARGPARDGDPGVSFFTWNLFRRFGRDWLEPWMDHVFRRMDAWGLNTVANWSSPRLWEQRRKPYVIPLSGWLTEVSYLGLPDVYSEEFLRQAEDRAREQCAGRKDDPWLLGYFPANEPPFPQKELQTVELILSGPDTETRRELERWLAEADTPERRKQFIDRAFDRYVQVTAQAIRRHDPNHLNLGMRSGGRPTDSEIAAARAFDVYSVNIYDFQVRPERIQRIAELTGKPVIIGEFHFGTPGRGLSAGLVQVRDLAERGTAYRYYVENALAMPELIGTHWFQWSDQPVTGRFDGENYNIGLVDVTDLPYVDLVQALQETHRRAYRLHRGELRPVSTSPAVN